MKVILEIANHHNCNACWNANPGEPDENGSIRSAWDMIGKWVRSVHIHDLFDPYPYRELFGLLAKSGYGDRFTMVEMGATSDPERVLMYYRRLWEELQPG